MGAIKVIELRDSGLDHEAIEQRIQEQMTRRMANGGYGPDPLALGPEDLRRQHRSVDATAPYGFLRLERDLEQLASREVLREHRFSSGKPVVGPIIVLLRRCWYCVSARWYVRPMLQQQADINAHLGGVMGELLRQQSATNVHLHTIIGELIQWQGIHAEHVRKLQSRIADLEVRLKTQAKG